METTTTGFIDKAINGLRTAAAELEEFQLQVALGKAEAADKYEEVKKKFHETIHEAKVKLNAGKEKITGLNQKLEELQSHLGSCQAGSKEAFNEQKGRILKTLLEIENILKITEAGTEFYLTLQHEIEKFRIKMEILQLQFELGKLDAKNEFEAKKAGFAKRIDELKKRFIENEQALGKDWAHFCNEMSESYDHLKKAFTV